MMNNLKPSKIFRSNFLFSDTAILVYLATFNFFLHLICINRYGFFRDEFYYIACGEHLSFGYVDHPPFIALVAAFTRWLLGDSILAIRFLAVLTSSCIVILTGLTARRLGAGRFGQALAALGIMISPTMLFLSHVLTMNVFEVFFWLLGAYLLIRLIQTQNSRYWLGLGLVLGVGLQNKHSMLFFGFGLFIALLFTPLRRQLLTRGPWLAAGLAFLIFLPNIIWQVIHGFPTLEFMRNAQQYKMSQVNPAEFLMGHIMDVHPLSFLLLLFGLYFYLFSRPGANFRAVCIIYLAVLILMVTQHAKTYYLLPGVPMILAAGGVQIERLLIRRKTSWLKAAIILILLVGGALTAPITLPVLSEETFIRYAKWLNVPMSSGERHDMGPLPQHYADMHGWEEMVASVAEVYNELSPTEKSDCALYMQNYGEAGAIDFLGGKYGLPKAISGHNSYYLWGYGTASGDIVIQLNNAEGYNELKEEFVEVECRGKIFHPYAMPYENSNCIYLCKNRRVKSPLQNIWPSTKHYI
jgi:hypothetical protein